MTIRIILFLLLGLYSGFSTAQDREYNVYLDTDNNSSTGCVVLQPDFATQFEGIDGYISIVTSTSPVVITDSLYHSCNAGSFDAGSPVVVSALGFNTNVNGDDVFEAEMNSSDLGIYGTSTVRLYYSTESDLSSDIVTVNNSGNEILVGVAFPIPALSVISLLILALIVLIFARKFFSNKAIVLASVMLFSTAVWAVFIFVIDGEVNDWDVFTPTNDPVGDTSTPANFSDITQVFANLEQDKFTVRMDVVDVENQAPTITSGNTVSVLENQTSVIDVESTDVNGDIEGAGLTYTLTGAIDDALFTIDVNSGIVNFIVAPDYEAPSDTGADNIYDLQVTVTDSGGLTDVQDLVVTVTNDINDDASVEFQTTASNTVDETTILNVAVELTALAPLTAPLSVDVVDAGGGTALSGTDYNAIGTQTITFPMGSAGGTVLNATLTPVGDINVEGDETVNLLLQNVSGPGTLGVQNNHEVTITDDDLANVSFQLSSSATANESTALNTDVVINIPGGGQLDTVVTVDVVDAGGGTATSGVDYNAFGVQTLTFPVGTTDGVLQSAVLTPIDDSDNEGNETVNLSLQNLVANSSVSLGVQTTHTATITDDEASVEFVLANSATANEAVSLNIGVILTTPVPLAAPLSVDVVDAGGGSATSGFDYTPVGTQTLTFPAGSMNGTTMNASFVPFNDDNVENNEDVNLLLQNIVGTGSIGAQSTHVVVITEDDAASVSFLTATSATIDESTPLNIGVQLTMPFGGQLEVPLSIDVVDSGGGTATSATDYSAFGTQTITFGVGAVTGNILNSVLTPIDDMDTEGDETVNLQLQNLNGPVLSSIGVQPTHTATITDDDNLPPVATDDLYAVTGNVGINVPVVSGVVTNDTDPNMDVLTVTAFDAVSAQGGAVNVSSDGSFSYLPPAGYTGADSFTYTVSDGIASDSGTVNLTVANKIWFIDHNAAAGGNGTLAAPFNTLSAFNSVNNNTGTNPGNGDCIFMDTGMINYTGPLTLLDNQKLIGEGATVTIPVACAITMATHSNTLPATSGTRPSISTTNADAITLANGNTIRGLNVGDTGTGTGISGSSFGTLAISESQITGTGRALNLFVGTVAVTLDSINSSMSSTEGVLFTGLSGNFTVTGATNISGPTGIGVSIQNTQAVYSFGDVTVNQRGSAGISINAISGGVQNITFGNVVINNQNGSVTSGFGIDNAVTAGSTITVANLTVDNNGVSQPALALSNNDGATINVNGGSLSNSSGATLSVSSSSGNANIAALVNNTSGSSVRILNNNGGTTIVSGNITDTGTGIIVDNNTGATTTFTGTLNLNTGVNTAFTATGGGTLNVTGTGSVLTTSTAAAVNMNGINIGASNVTFQSVNSDGGNSGIIMNTLGGIGSFNITGVGTTSGSGGTIQNKALNGILAQNSSNINLSNMNFTSANTSDSGAANTNGALIFNTATNVNLVNLSISGHVEHGILGSSVTNLDISNTTITGTGADTETNEHSIFITNLLGSGASASVFDNLTINDSQDTAIRIENSVASTSLLTVQNSTITNAGDTGLNFITTNAAVNLTANVTGSTLTNTVDGVTYETQAGNLIGTVGGAGGLSNTFTPGVSGDMVNAIRFLALSNSGGFMNGTALNNDITLDAVKIGGIAPVSSLNGVGIGTNSTGTVRAVVDSNVINSSFSGELTQTVSGVLIDNEGTGTISQNVIRIENNIITLNPAPGTNKAETVGIGVDGGFSGGGITTRSVNNIIVATGDDSNGASVGVQILPTETGDPAATNNRVCIGFTGNDVTTPNNPFAGTFLTGELDVIAAPVESGSFLDVENSPAGVRTPAQLKADLEPQNTNTEVGDTTGFISGQIAGVASCPN